MHSNPVDSIKKYFHVIWANPFLYLIWKNLPGPMCSNEAESTARKVYSTNSLKPNYSSNELLCGLISDCHSIIKYITSIKTLSW